VYDSVLRDENGTTRKVMRRIPSCLDVAFSVLGNSQIVPELVARMTDPAGRAFRDGLPYQHNLAAAREVIDNQRPDVWDASIYTQWLAALRELSTPTTDLHYPEAMRTRAWAMKTLNAQLASWTALRHDTMLYAKPSYTGLEICSYPAGFVEPRPEVWDRLGRLALRTAELLGQLTFQGTAVLTQPGFERRDVFVSLSGIQSQQIAFLNQFADKTATLKSIAVKELRQEPLSGAETGLLTNLIQSGGRFGGCTPRRKFDGWYPQLFYRSTIYPSSDPFFEMFFHYNAGSARWDPLVVDVHTDPPDPDVGDPGSVLHEAIGNVDLLTIAVDNGGDRMVFAGPVLSHYEFEMIGPPQRKTDTEWRSDGLQAKWPAPPAWTQDYLVPGQPQIWWESP